VQQEGGITRGQEGGTRGGKTITSFVIIHRATLAIDNVVLYCAAMALHSIIVCCTAMAIRGIVFGRTTMAIGEVIFFSLTAMGIRGVVFCPGTFLVVGIIVFHCATPLLVICRTTTAMHGKHDNQTKEGCAAKICKMAAVDGGSVGGNDGKDASTTAAMMPVQQERWNGHNNKEDASNRSNVLGNNQLAQQKDKRVDKRNGVEDMTRLQWGIR
jgi:hypothetical protein